MRFPSVRVGGAERVPFAVLAIGGSPGLVALSARTPWWVGASVVTVLLVTVTVRVNGRTSVRWLLDWVEYRFGRARRAAELVTVAQLQDVQTPSGICGIRASETTLIAMIQLAPDLDLPTVIADKTIYTEDTVPVDALVSMLDHYGVAVDIDIVTTGQRVRPTGSYSMLYDQLIGTHAVVGDRLTWLVVRLDQQRNLDVLARRGPCAVVAPKALAAAALRIAGRLRERGIQAHALPAVALRDATRLLHAGVELSDLRETWSTMESSAPGRCVTSFQIDWTRLDGAGLDDCWSWNSGRTTLVVGLTADSGPRALVRFIGPPVDRKDLPDYLRLISGRQASALLASLPTELPMDALPAEETGSDVATIDQLWDLPIAIGPNGQILGAVSGQPRHTLALPLFDPARYNPRRRSIDVRAQLPVAQQILLRATVVGAEVEIHTARPQRWRQLISAVGDPSTLRLAEDDNGSGPTSTATIAVFDQVPAHASAAQTTVTISDPGVPRRRAADLAIDQVSATAVDVSIPMRRVRVDLIEPRGETRYLDATDVPPQAAPPAGSEVALLAPPGGRRVG
ncbi:type VII secretion protein EccE [Nocardia cyriacigeorgica]|uniref:Type VII secretion protein EccE n=1 Tax=Nocardia cyriacigeorgica TaxID=135487 RepID=A0A6P1D853_9NOCA|nr:type VII secretion protein EccE [Nocardia cyriacigeorgica]NEW40657.1 type VII secretion protein EccE [Nocardia cyriacigeorgica]NEW45130.1 type VII secretion protein EccE [Nocardia cyriacigeorgica]NEW51115.1 type VII secretion protein EccE [Nocardia cyriacigeorgica]NEW54302.1 type VII secretion protein EccE [Nocardia cyriacigeorgica]